MTTKPKALKFRIRRSSSTAEAGEPDQPAVQPAAPAPPPVGPDVASAAGASSSADSPRAANAVSAKAGETDIDAIRREGLTGRQLRMARRVAQKNGLAVTSDFDAVRQLRQRGIDPFQRTNVLELIVPNSDQTKQAESQMQAATAQTPAGLARVQLPQTVAHGKNLPSTNLGTDNPADRRAGEIRRIQRDIARRRRKNILAMIGRLTVFVTLPTIAAAYYFFAVATPMYGTKAEFIINQAEASGGGGLGSLFSGTGLATQTDSTTVQSYITSREAFFRLDAGHGFKAHFQQDHIDPIQRLAPDATNEAAYGVFQDHVQVGYDPTEGILKMEVIAADPTKSQEFSEALIGYAEEQVDQLTQRVRTEQMTGARENYERAEARRAEALAELVRIQEEVQQPDPLGETAALQQRITTLQIELDQERLNLASLNERRNPNAGQVSAAQSQIMLLENQIDLLRGQLSGGTGGSLVSNNARLRQAEENYAFEVATVQAALATMDSARIEANRQVRYLSVSVAPIAPDEPTYPQAFENTLLAFLIFSGIYLMISLTASILREQVSS